MLFWPDVSWTSFCVGYISFWWLYTMLWLTVPCLTFKWFPIFWLEKQFLYHMSSLVLLQNNFLSGMLIRGQEHFQVKLILLSCPPEMIHSPTNSRCIYVCFSMPLPTLDLLPSDILQILCHSWKCLYRSKILKYLPVVFWCCFMFWPLKL